MNKNVLTVFCAAVLATACGGGGGGGGTDAGNDAGSIIIPDTGTVPVDAFTPPACDLVAEPGNFGSLSAGCFPRCAMATLTTVAGCTTAECQQTALMGDTTPGTAWSVNGTAQTMPLNCGGCFQNQQFHCFSVSGCAAEVDAVVACAAGGGSACTTEVNALNACGSTNMAAVQACANSATTGVIACFQR